MSDHGVPGLPLWLMVPASLALLLLLFQALRISGSTSARYVVFACWARFMLSSFHTYTFPKVVGDISGTALGSATLFLLGAAIIPRALLLNRGIASAYLVFIAGALSAAVNTSFVQAFEPITKFGLLIVVALHCFNALRSGDERRFTVALLLSFVPLILFQVFSLILNVPKATEGAGGESYIGGYYQEAAFSIALVGLLIVAAVARSIPRWTKAIIIPVATVGILFANYRTAIMAMIPLIIYYLLYALSRLVAHNLRTLLVVVAGAGIVVSGGTALMTLDRFQDLRTIATAEKPLIKPPDEFTTQDRRLLSGRTQIWSDYYYKWKDDGTQVQHLVGFGPDSWETYFNLYAHNTFVSFLFEYGLLGVAALCMLFLAGLIAAFRTGVHRWKMIAAHLSFITLNLATMPFWLVEGIIVYALLVGYTLYYASLPAFSFRQPPYEPRLSPVRA
jgi:O-antigen ligase